MEFIQALDNSIILWVQEFLRCDFLDLIMPYITFLGNGGILWILLGIAFTIYKPTRTWGVLILASLAFEFVICNMILKPSIARIRPYDLLGYDIIIPPEKDFSFPSGHTSAAFAAAVVIFKYRKSYGIAALTAATVIAFSRLYLGVHFLTDILAGAVVGAVAALIVVKFARKKNFI